MRWDFSPQIGFKKIVRVIMPSPPHKSQFDAHYINPPEIFHFLFFKRSSIPYITANKRFICIAPMRFSTALVRLILRVSERHNRSVL